MARFNPKVPRYHGPDTVNVAGGEAHQESVELELVSILLTSMVQDRFYRKAGQELNRLTTLVDALVAEGKGYFCAQAGVYARREFGLRSITHVLAALLARRVRGADWTKDFYNAIVRRPDDMLEIMSIILGTGNNVPNALKDGFARALVRIDEYGLAKYKGEGKAVKMVDVVNLCHPKDPPTLNQSPLRKLMRSNIGPAQTWEAGLSDVGQKAKSEPEKTILKANVWADLLIKEKVGYLALLRNIRNIIETVQAPPILQLACEQLTDLNAIKKSLVFPFQLQTAYEIISDLDHPNSRMFMKALNTAAEYSLINVPVFDGDTLIAMDLSGSMTAAVGTSTAAKVGGLFAAVLWKNNPNSELMIFGSHAEYLPLKGLDIGLFNLAAQLARSNQGGTNFHNIFRTAKRKYDRIIIISDCQAWEEHETPKQALLEYQKKFNVRPHIYSMDLCGLGTLQFPENKVYAIAGFSDKIFDVMKMLETDRQALINTIKTIDIKAVSDGLNNWRK